MHWQGQGNALLGWTTTHSPTIQGVPCPIVPPSHLHSMSICPSRTHHDRGQAGQTHVPLALSPWPYFGAKTQGSSLPKHHPCHPQRCRAPLMQILPSDHCTAASMETQGRRCSHCPQTMQKGWGCCLHGPSPVLHSRACWPIQGQTHQGTHRWGHSLRGSLLQSLLCGSHEGTFYGSHDRGQRTV